MKKNKTLRMAAVLLILVLLTTGIISGTLAKYTTTGSAKDTARVAKWGVTVTTSGSLYSNAYAKQATGNVPAAWAQADITSGAITVATKTNDATDNIVAPGTESAGTGLSFSVTGTPEVAVDVGITVSAEDIYLAEGKYGVMVKETVNSAEAFDVLKKANGNKAYTYDVDAKTFAEATAYDSAKTEYYVLTSEADVADGGYFPVKYKLGNVVTEGKAAAVALELAKKIDTNTTEKTATDGYKVEYITTSATLPANTDLATSLALSSQQISWKWAHESDSTDANVKKNINACDTVLGDLIAAKKDNTVTYKVVAIEGDTITELAFGTETGKEYTVTKGVGGAVVANLRTMVDISLTVTQVD